MAASQACDAFLDSRMQGYLRGITTTAGFPEIRFDPFPGSSRAINRIESGRGQSKLAPIGFEWDGRMPRLPDDLIGQAPGKLLIVGQDTGPIEDDVHSPRWDSR